MTMEPPASPDRFSGWCLEPEHWIAAQPEALGPRLWRLPLLSAAGCTAVLARIDAANAASQAPNSMHEHGIELDGLGLGALLDSLLERTCPLAAERLAPFGGAALDQRYGYLVHYARDADQELGFHVDDSEVTLNLCLEQEGSGAELVMLGERCDLHRQEEPSPSETLEIEHEPGVAIVHLGVHRHRVEAIQRGRRRNLILWCKNSSLRTGPQGRDPVPHGTWCPGS